MRKVNVHLLTCRRGNHIANVFLEKTERKEWQTVNPFYSLLLSIQPQIFFSSPTKPHLIRHIRCTMEMVTTGRKRTHLVSKSAGQTLPSHFPTLWLWSSYLTSPHSASPSGSWFPHLWNGAILRVRDAMWIPNSLHLVLCLSDSRCEMNDNHNSSGSKLNTSLFFQRSSQQLNFIFHWLRTTFV